MPTEKKCPKCKSVMVLATLTMSSVSASAVCVSASGISESEPDIAFICEACGYYERDSSDRPRE